MPKRVKKPSTDPNRRAHQLLAEHMAKTDAPAVPASVSAYMRAIGSKGGTISGAKRMEMPEKLRKAIAKKGAAARWKKT